MNQNYEPARPIGGSVTGRVLIWSLLLFFAVVFLLPLFVMVMTSLKTLDEIHDGNMLAFPRSPTIVPWLKAWGEACIGLSCDGIRGYFGNSLMLVAPAVTISTLLGALNGYVLTKWRFPGHNYVFALMLFACFIPFQAVLIPVARVLGLVGLGNSIGGLILVHIVYGLGFTTLFFRNYYETFPTELIRAGLIDGAGFFQIFQRIVLPASGPIIIVTVIFQFTNIWNDFLFGASFTSGARVPITVALNNLVNTSSGVREYNVDMAAAMIAALPTLAVYVAAGRYFVRGLMAGAVKG
jgi:glucose/mannose transport system permease protein